MVFQYIGAIRGPGIVIADMSSVLKYSELNGRCLAILRLGGTKVDDNAGIEVISSSTESIEGPTEPPDQSPDPTPDPTPAPTYPPTSTTGEPSAKPEPEPTVTDPSLPPLPPGTTEGRERGNR